MRHQTEKKHPDRYARDLSPNRMAGQNIGHEAAGDRTYARTAAEVKELTRNLEGFTLDELREIPVLKAGARLKQGATYLDLKSGGEPFTATGDMEASRDNFYVPKAETPHPLWNRLLGYETPQRTE